MEQYFHYQQGKYTGDRQNSGHKHSPAVYGYVTACGTAYSVYQKQRRQPADTAFQRCEIGTAGKGKTINNPNRNDNGAYQQQNIHFNS